jgi:hydroxyacylglutathione hydrolase
VLYLSDEGGPDWQYAFPHKGLRDGDVIRVGNLSLQVLHTPGHTPESISLLLTDHPATDEPVMVFTGDFVFVGDIGRPDLLEKAAGQAGTMEAGARQLFRSLRRFSALPDHVQVWPAHGAGSACGKALGTVPGSTVGYEKIRNWAFGTAMQEEQAFIQAVLAGQPEPPKYFARMKHLNKADRPLVPAVPRYPQLTQNAFLSAYRKGIRVIDTRPKTAFANGFIPGSLNIPGNNALATWCGWLLNYQEQFMLVAEEGQIKELARKLMRIGLDNVYGYITDVHLPGLPLQQAGLADLHMLNSYVDNDSVQIVDVRGQAEFETGHIPGAENIFAGTLPDQLHRIRRNQPVVLYCQSGDRAAIAYSLLRHHGFTNVLQYHGGMREWKEAGAAVCNTAACSVVKV